MPSTTLTMVRTSRRLSISIVASNSPPILYVLPSELITAILELALVESKKDLPALLCTSKDICTLVERVIYRTVVLASASTIELLHRTVTAKAPAFLLEHVKQLAITCEPESCNYRTGRLVADIVGACRGLHSLALPCFPSFPLASIVSKLGLAPNAPQITIQAYNEAPSRTAPPCQRLPIFPVECDSIITQLCISEPSDTWQSPRATLNAFGALPKVSKLHMARRMGANEENDDIFIKEITEILKDRSTLQQLAISVFAPAWSSEQDSIEESNIWRLLTQLQKVDERISIRQGVYREWAEEWKGPEVMVKAIGPANYWTRVQATTLPISTST